MKSVFDPAVQQADLDSKIVVALERLSNVFRVKLWQENRRHGLSPIQLQILVFLLFHERKLATVSQLAREYNVTPPTISDAVRVLESKGLLESVRDRQDRRVAILVLSARGKAIAREVSLFAHDVKQEVAKLEAGGKASLLQSLLHTIEGLQAAGVISPARMCLSCRFFERRPDATCYCRLMEKLLASTDLRIDCPEHLRRAS